MRTTLFGGSVYAEMDDQGLIFFAMQVAEQVTVVFLYFWVVKND